MLERFALRPGSEAGKERRLEGHPDTNGRAGGKLPAGKTAVRSPCRSFLAACRKADATGRGTKRLFGDSGIRLDTPSQLPEVPEYSRAGSRAGELPKDKLVITYCT